MKHKQNRSTVLIISIAKKSITFKKINDSANKIVRTNHLQTLWSKFLIFSKYSSSKCFIFKNKDKSFLIVKHTQTISRLFPTNYLSVFDHFVELTLKVSIEKRSFQRKKKKIYVFNAIICKFLCTLFAFIMTSFENKKNCSA